MKKDRIVIAATKSGSGKTLLTCAMLKALVMRGLNVAAVKCGPDYIDPMFHEEILEVPSKNLDLFFTNEEQTRGLFLQDNESDISVIEGVMGLYDGLGGVSEEASTYHLARALNAPIVLVINARGMGRSILAEIAGFLSMDRERLIAGVILNCISGMFFESIKPVIEQELQIPVLGYYPMQQDLKLESRHLGLKLPQEVNDLKEMARLAALKLEKTVDVDRILAIAADAQELVCEPWDKQVCKLLNGDVPKAKGVRIAIARDEAFCFYYADNLKMLESFGATLIPFSPVHDKELPKDIHGIILGGGYPELYAKALAQNEGMKESIRKAIDNNIPSLAECGGFMYLHETMQTQDGEEYAMVGKISGNCSYRNKLVRFGYIFMKEKENVFLGGDGKTVICAHEFHYFDSDQNGCDCVATKPLTGRTWDAAHVDANHWWGFAHLYYPSNPLFAAQFVRSCEKYNE